MKIDLSLSLLLSRWSARIWHALMAGGQLVVITVLLGCVHTGVRASQSSNDVVPTKLDTVISRGILRVGTTGDFAPFSYRTESPSMYRGIDIELANDLATALGVEVVFIRTQWGSLIDDLLNDRFDIGVGGITITPARKKVALFSEATSTNGKVAISRDENAHRFATLAGINRPGVRVIVNPGGTNEAFSREHFPNATIVVNEDNLTIFENLVAGRGDVMVTDRIEAIIQERLHPELQVVNPDSPFNTFEFGFLLPRDQAFKAFVDAWLQSRKDDGTFGRIFKEELQRATAEAAGSPSS